MKSPKVSVIIPTYNGAKYLGEAIQSVLDQSYPHFELIVVDDVSLDHTKEVVGQFDDKRLTYILHKDNRGAVAARKTGVDASSGEIIAFLDQDDLFHSEKLETHVDFLRRHPEIGVSYNSRFEYEQESQAIRAIWQPPDRVTLADLVLGFPFSPSDTVLRRELALREDIWDQSYVLEGEEMIFNGAEIIMGGRLALDGCQFANIGRALNYRRFHPRRVFRNIPGRCQAELTCQAIILDDPRCPEDVRVLRDEAFMNTYLIWAYYIFAQDETEFGQSFVRKALKLNPSLLDGEPSRLLSFLAANSADDGSVDFEMHLNKIIKQLPPEISFPSSQIERVLAQGYLVKGAQAILWNRPEEGRIFLACASTKGAEVDEALVQNLTHQLLVYQREFGSEATQNVMNNLTASLKEVDRNMNGSRLRGSFSINQAFESYRAGEYDQVPGQVLQAITSEPKYLWNRGVLAILFRSSTGIRLQPDS